MDPIKCTHFNPCNKIPVEISVHHAPELTELSRVKETGKAVIEKHKVTRKKGYELRFEKAGAVISCFLTSAQLKKHVAQCNTLIE